MPIRKNKCPELKKKAKNAKKRLATGYWDIVKQRKEIALTTSDTVVMDKAAIGAYCRRNYGAETAQAYIVADMIEDERLYKKVCAFLASDIVVSNPIGLLLDKDKLNGLDEAAKNRYVLQMSNKYREMCERYNKEQRHTNG